MNTPYNRPVSSDLFPRRPHPPSHSQCKVKYELWSGLLFTHISLKNISVQIYSAYLLDTLWSVLTNSHQNMRKSVLAVCEQQLCKSDCASAHTHISVFRFLKRVVAIPSQDSTIPASLCSITGGFEPFLVANAEYRYGCNDAHLTAWDP